ncbi:MAG: flagellar assembly protein A [Bacillota bacterium]
MDFQVRIARDKMAAYLRLLEEKQLEPIAAGEDSSTEQGEQPDEKDKPMEPEKPLLSRELVAARLAEAGVVFGIDWETVDTLIHHRVIGQETCIAKGLPPKPGQDAYIQPVYLEKHIKTRETSDDQRVDYLDYGRIISVEPGELLAVKVPPRPGEPGKNVFGQEIAPPVPRDLILIAGPGVKVEDEGVRVVAATAGRPEQKKNLFAVYPIHTVNGNVDVTTGHIKFKGDLVIKGNITDGMRVEAKGKLEVHGGIAHSAVSAGGSIKVGQSILGSTVRAGGSWAQFKLAHDFLDKTIAAMEELMASARQLKDHPGLAGTAQVKQNGEGIIIKILLEKKYSNLPGLLANLVEKLGELEQEAVPVEVVEQARICCQEAISCFSGLGPLRFSSLEEAEPIIQKLQAAARQYAECYLDKDMEQANITASYAQNSKLFASGKVKITGKGAYYCDIIAANEVVIDGNPGIFRNGSIVAGRNVRVMELGSPSEAPTKVEVPSGAVISAGKVYPGVFLKAGVRGERIQMFIQGLKFSE